MKITKLTKLAALITLCAFFLAQSSVYRPVLADPAAQPTSYEEVGAHLEYWANSYNIPPAVLKAVAWMESGWRQYNSNGEPLVGSDGIGLGIMQISNYNPNDQEEVNRLKYDVDYNIERGAQILNQKWRAYPKIGNGDRNVLENWYFAVWGYNGWSSVNNPNQPGSKGSGAYQDVVFELMGQKYNSAITFAPGATKIPRASLPASGLPNLESQWATPEKAHRGDLKIDVNNLVSAGGWYGDASGDYWYNYSTWSSYYALGFYITAYNGAAAADKPVLEQKILAAYRNLLQAADDLLINNNGSEVVVRRASKYYWTVWQGPMLDQSLSDQAWQGVGRANLKAAQMNLGTGMDEVLGTAAKELPVLQTGESALGSWAADTMKAQVPSAQLALLNPETFSTGLAPGELTRGEIYELIPQDYRLVSLELTGAEIRALLEEGITSGQMLQVSGLKYTWDPAQAENKRIQSLTLADGTALDSAKSYRVVTTDYPAAGQQGFSGFRNGQNKQDTYILLRDALLADLSTRQSLSGEPDGRIKQVSKPAPVAKKYAEVTASALNLRTGPGTGYGVAATLPKGTKVELISTANGWAKVLYNGKTYYAAAQYVKEITPSTSVPSAPSVPSVPASPAPAAPTTQTGAQLAEVTAGYLNMRTGPGTNYQAAGMLTKGTRVELLSTSNGWAKIKYQGKVYYVAAAYLKATGTSNSSGVTPAPVPAAPPAATTVKYVTTTANYLNLRTGPGTNYPAAGNLAKGTKVELLSSANGWAKIRYAGKEYYVAAQYLI